MTTVAAPRCDDAPPERSAEWRGRSGRLYEELRRPARAVIRRAFRGACGDDEIEDIRRYLLTAVANHASKELRRRTRRPAAPLESSHAVPDDRMLPDERAAKL